MTWFQKLKSSSLESCNKKGHQGRCCDTADVSKCLLRTVFPQEKCKYACVPGLVLQVDPTMNS